MARIVLCRHAATQNNAAGGFLSFSDPPLSESGRIECERLRADLQRLEFVRCYVSPMRRCLETRKIVAPALPFAIEDALREVNFGEWEGKTVEWLERHAPQELAHRRRDPVTFRPPGGESIEEAATRLHAVAKRIRSDDGALVIGHRVILGILERLLRDLPLNSSLVTPLEPAEFRILLE